MENIADTLAKHGLIQDSQVAYTQGLMRMSSVLILYRHFVPTMPPIVQILQRYGIKASQLPEPTEQDIIHAWSKTDGKSRNIDEWLLLTADPDIEPQAPKLTQDEAGEPKTQEVTQTLLTHATDKRGKPGEA